MAILLWIGVAVGSIGVVAMVAWLVLMVTGDEKPHSSASMTLSTHRSRAQIVQMICSLAAGLLGVVLPFIGLRYVLVEDGEPFRWSLLALLASLPVGIAVVAWLHVTLRNGVVLVVLWSLSLLLLAFAVVGSVTFGFFLLPSALLGIAASVAGTLDRRRATNSSAARVLCVVLLGAIGLAACGDGTLDDAVTATAEPAPSVTVTEATRTSTPSNGEPMGAAMMTPDDSGMCRAYSLEDAQSVSLFQLVLPDDLPESLRFEVLMLYPMMSEPIVPKDCDGSDYVEAWYGVYIDGQRHSPIKFAQTTWQPSFQDYDTESMHISGADITRYSSSMETDTTVLFGWQDSGISYTLHVPGDTPIDEDDLRTLIGSIVENGRAD